MKFKVIIILNHKMGMPEKESKGVRERGGKERVREMSLTHEWCLVCFAHRSRTGV